MRMIDRVAVLGSGTMGAQIAAHFANAGVSSLLLDVTSPVGNRSSAAIEGLRRAQQRKPSPFFSHRAVSRIETGNFDDDLPRVRECDWIIEAVTEDASIKRALWRRVIPYCGADTILSTNTSGIQQSVMMIGFPLLVQERFLGTHFFNPPRYLHLLEVIPGVPTRADLVHFVKEFGEQVLGKGVVVCKDTPNFVANRIGCFFSSVIQHAMVEGGYSIEEVDEWTGPLLGLPKSASFRLIDIIGLDVWMQVAKNVYGNTSDVWRDRFRPLPYADVMMSRKWLGDKTEQGFYRRLASDKSIEVLDWNTLSYRPYRRPISDAVEAVKRNPDVAARIHALLDRDDRTGHFVWRILRDLFAYCLDVIPEVSDRIVDVDRAMRWGFGHKYGPFELWDKLGFQLITRRMESDGIALPRNLLGMLSAGVSSLYGSNQYWDVKGGTFHALEERPGVLLLSNFKRKDDRLDGDAEASLINLDDGILCLEFHSKMNAIGDGTLHLMERALAVLSSDFQALIIANEGENFSVGANLATLLHFVREDNFAAIEDFIRRFQHLLQRLKYTAKPVVAAAFSRTLGGGCEVMLHCLRVQASAELYAGLVELNVGLIPAGGGTKELAMRFSDPTNGFDLVANAKVSQSAEEARQLGLLRDEDRITMNPERLIGDAKAFALQLVNGDQPEMPSKAIHISGELGYQAMLRTIESRKAAGQSSEYDAAVLEKLAYVLSCGRAASGSIVTEQQLLDLELEAFLSLCGMPKTQLRIEHMLRNGVPLRN
jgi:3-hydroxyacyl-CoA dehydrogenase